MCAITVNVQQGKIRIVHTGQKKREKLLNIDRSGILLEKGEKLRMFVFQPLIS